MRIVSLKFLLVLFFFNFAPLKAENIKSIEFLGNNRIPNETIQMLANVDENDTINYDKIDKILKDLYESNFFEDIQIKFEQNILTIVVVEYPLINQINFQGIKSNTIIENITENLNLKNRSSFNPILFKEDIKKIKSNLKTMGYYFADVETFVEDLSDNKVNLNYNINIGDKAKIKKISFLGNKIFKDGKLKNIILSEEYKFWKIISGKKYLNEDLINFDKRLLKNFYLNQGYHDVEINSSFAKLSNKNDFDLIYNIEANEKFYFNELNLNLPIDYNKENFNRINTIFGRLKNEPYSINSVNEIIEEIETIVLDSQFESTKAIVNKNIISNKINLDFNVELVERFTIERINIFGNTVTQENVIRNNLSIDEGDIFNEILAKKSENNIKSLNLFRNVETKVLNGKKEKTKIIDIKVEEKPTGEIMAGAGVGTDGSSLSFGVKENNYLGRGVGLDASFTVTEDSLKGNLGINNPNFKNSDKSLNVNIESSETDKLKTYGYKSNRNGFSFGTDFEYLNDLNLGVGTSTFYEKIETDSTASSRQKKMSGDYFDIFTKINLDYDKRNQKFRASKGFRSNYNIALPIISKTSTLKNTYDFKYYKSLYDENVSSAGFLIKTSNSINNKDVKLSERLFIPSSRLRGFEYGKIGPKDGGDYVGGNFLTAFNFNSNIPQLFPSAENFEFLFFVDAANIWGVDYDSSLDKNSKIRSSFGIAVDWMTVAGPLNFSFAQPITKSDSDTIENFRFNLGTTF